MVASQWYRGPRETNGGSGGNGSADDGGGGNAGGGDNSGGDGSGGDGSGNVCRSGGSDGGGGDGGSGGGDDDVSGCFGDGGGGHSADVIPDTICSTAKPAWQRGPLCLITLITKPTWRPSKAANDVTCGL